MFSPCYSILRVRCLGAVLLWLLCAQALAAKPLVLASIEPLARLAQEYYGQEVQVRTLLLPSQNPHQVSFTPQQLLLLHQAQLVVWLGDAAEPYLSPYLDKRTQAAVALLAQPGVVALTEGDADHAGGVDPHLWLAPLELAKLLPALQQEGVRLGLPTPALARRTQVMQQQLQEMQRQAQQRLQPWNKTPWLTYHNPWYYLQQSLGLAAPLQVEEQLGTEIGSRHFLQLAQAMRQERVGCALLEPEARRAVMEKLCAAPACKLVALDPLGRDAGAASYSQWWRGLVSKFQQCLQ